MNPLQEFLTKLRQNQTEIETRANSSLKELEPIDQVEATSAVKAALQDSKWIRDRIVELGDTLKAALADVSETTLKIAEPVMASKIEAGELVEKLAHETSVVAARADERKQVEDTYQAEKEENQKLTERRAAAVKAQGPAAAALTNDDLKADDFEQRLASLGNRVTKLNEQGIKAEKGEENFVTILAHSFDEAGDKRFDSQLATILSI